MEKPGITACLLVVALVVLAGCISPPAQGNDANEAAQQDSAVGVPPAQGSAEDGGVQIDEGEQQPEGRVEVIDSFSFVNDTGFYKVSGILQNTGDVPVKFVSAKLALAKQNGETEVWDNATVCPERLVPGENGGFVIVVGNPDDYTGENSVEIAGFDVDTAEPYMGVEVAVENPRDLGDYYTVGGTVANTGRQPVPAPGYKACALFYNADGHVVETGQTPVRAGLMPGDSIPVSFTVRHPSESLKITSVDVAIDFTTSG